MHQISAHLLPLTAATRTHTAEYTTCSITYHLPAGVMRYLAKMFADNVFIVCLMLFFVYMHELLRK